MTSDLHTLKGSPFDPATDVPDVHDFAVVCDGYLVIRRSTSSMPTYLTYRSRRGAVVALARAQAQLPHAELWERP